MTTVTGLRSLAQGWLDPVDAFVRATGNQPLAWQEPYLRETRDTVNLKGRQVGASTCGGVLAIRTARLRPRTLSLIVSPSLKQSTEVKDRARDGLLRMGVSLVRDSQDVIELGNGSRIVSLPGSPKSVRGWSADFLIIDEAAFLDPETFLAARATVAATGGRVIVQSTPAGPYGHFFDLWEEAADPASRWARYSVSSEDCSTIDKDFLASERATLSAEDYAQEYLGQFRAGGLGLVDPAKMRASAQQPGPGPSESVWDRLRDAK